MKTPPKRLMVGDRVAVYKRGKRGLYQADYHYAGQHRRQSLKTTNLKVATTRALALAVKLQEGTLGIHSATQPSSTVRTSLDDARLEFIASKRADGRQKKTLVKYDGILRNFIAFSKAHHVKRVDQVTLQLIDAFRTMRSEAVVRKKKLSATQKHLDISLLKQFFTWCADRKMAVENPLATQKNPRPPRMRKDRVLTLGQVDAILQALPRRILGPIAVLAFGGMRSANCAQLLVSDVDFDAGWIYVRSVEGARTKCGNEWKVPLHPRLRALLESLPRRKKGYYFTAPPSRKYPDGEHGINTKLLNEDFEEVLTSTFALYAAKATAFSRSCLSFLDPGPCRGSDETCRRTLWRRSVASISANDGSVFETYHGQASGRQAR